MSTAPKQKEDDLASTVRLRLVDPLGRAIEGLKYEVRQGGRVLSRGVTDAEGRLKQFGTTVGQGVSVMVEQFLTSQMTEIRKLVPWNERFSASLVSGKIKQTARSAEHKPAAPAAGSYQRKTYKVKTGDSLSAIAGRHQTSAQAIADLNRISLEAIIHPGQVLKLPLPSERTGAAPASAPAMTSGSVAESSAPANPTPSAANAQTAGPTEGRHETLGGPPAEPVQTEVPVRPPAPKAPPPTTPVTQQRGENGTPKTELALVCQSACIKLGDTGPLIEELNVRLMGFGGTVSPGVPFNQFTARTEAAVRQFQRDVMGVGPTGKVCGGFLRALDSFRERYPVSLTAMRCRCGHCSGFGNGYRDSKAVRMFKNAAKETPYHGTEFPGMHRALLWSMKAALFYVSVTDKALGYKFLRVSSGYRCWHDNKAHSRKSTNHMGNALDLQFTKGASTTRCAGADVDALRAKVFVKRLGAQLGWPESNLISLETAQQGATSWVHFDVREFDASYKDSRYYAVTQAAVDGDPLVEVARREGRLGLIACGGLVPRVPPSQSKPPDLPLAEQRHPVTSLRVSPQGLDFIKGYEKLSLKAYDDSEGYATIGWGHLIDHSSCAALKGSAAMKPFVNGLTRQQADALLAEDVLQAEQVVKRAVQVPLFQHEYDALVSLIFNLGGFRKCPKLLTKLNTRDYSGCCDEFADITNGGVAGLVARRKGEMKMFRNKVYDSTH